MAAEIIGRSKYANFIGRLQGLWPVRDKDRNRWHTFAMGTEGSNLDNQGEKMPPKRRSKHIILNVVRIHTTITWATPAFNDWKLILIKSFSRLTNLSQNFAFQLHFHCFKKCYLPGSASKGQAGIATLFSKAVRSPSSCEAGGVHILNNKDN